MDNHNLFIVIAAAAGSATLAGFVTFYVLRTKSAQAQDAATTSRETELRNLRAAAEGQRKECEQKIDLLQDQLRDAVGAKSRLEGASESLMALKEELRERDSRIRELDDAINGLTEKSSRAETEVRAANSAREEALAQKDAEVTKLLEAKDQSVRAQLQEKDRHIEEQQRMLDRAQEELTKTFDSLSVKALTTVSDEFLKMAKATFETANAESKGDARLQKQAFEELMKPVAENLARLQELEKKRSAEFACLDKGIERVTCVTEKVINAFRKPTTRGSWSEMILEQILNDAGLIREIHYDVQDTTEDGDGGRLRADVVLHLPSGRDLVIDSKAPIDSAWEDGPSPDDATELARRASFAKLVRDHVKQLSSKAYWTRYKSAPDCIVMFVPSEAAYLAAVEGDPTLTSDALANRVYLASPMMLVSMVHMAAYVLQEEALRQNAHEVQIVASQLYDRLAVFAGSMKDLGGALRRTVDRFNGAVGSLEGRVLPQGRKLSALGAGAQKELPEVTSIECAPRPLTSPEAVQDEGQDAA